MHEYRRLVEERMAAKNLVGRGAQAELARMAGLNRQVIHTILNDNRKALNQAPDEKTVNGLAAAFDLSPDVVWAAVAVSMGMPSYVVPSITQEVKAASDEELLRELSARLGLVATFRTKGAATEEGKKIKRATGRSLQAPPKSSDD